MTRILVVILAIFLLNTCDLAQIPPSSTKQAEVVYPFTLTTDIRFNGVFYSKYDGEGACVITFNGTHYVEVKRHWTYTTPAYIEYYKRYLHFYGDGSISVDMDNPEFGYTFYEFSFKKTTYSWNSDGSILTIDGHEYGRNF
jgi:hypothetical protein